MTAAMGTIEQRVLPIEGVEWRESGAAAGEMTVRGHAAVCDRLSLDLGGFRERIAKGAFTNVLDRGPDLHAVWDHDTRYVLARTKNRTLELREDPAGLHFWARVAPTSYADDLRVLMERGDVDGASFAFTVERDNWEIDERENVTRTILEVRDLYDVTVCAQGAYPQADSALVRSLRTRMQSEIQAGHLPAGAEAVLPEPVSTGRQLAGATSVALQRAGAEAEPSRDAGGDADPSHPVGGDEDEAERFAVYRRREQFEAFRRQARVRLDVHQRLLKEHTS